MLIPRHELNRHRPAKTLPVNHNFSILRLLLVSDPVEPRLRVYHETLLVGRPGREAVAAILEHENIAADALFEDAADGESMSDVPRIAVKREDREVLRHAFVRGANEERMESLAIGGRDLQLVVVGYAELGGTGDASLGA